MLRVPDPVGRRPLDPVQQVVVGFRDRPGGLEKQGVVRSEKSDTCPEGWFGMSGVGRVRNAVLTTRSRAPPHSRWGRRRPGRSRSSGRMITALSRSTRQRVWHRCDHHGAVCQQPHPTPRPEWVPAVPVDGQVHDHHHQPGHRPVGGGQGHGGSKNLSVTDSWRWHHHRADGRHRNPGAGHPPGRNRRLQGRRARGVRDRVGTTTEPRPTPTMTCSSLNRSSQCLDRTPNWTAVSRCSAPR